MKLNLLLNNAKDVRSGYVNVDPYAADCPDRTQGLLHDLGKLVDENEATEIIALDVLDHYPSDQVDAVLDHWLSRLAHGGRLTISAVDVREVARMYLANAINIDELNTLLHGSQDDSGRFRQSSMTLNLLAEVLENKGLRILTKRVTDRRAVITCQRP